MEQLKRKSMTTPRDDNDDGDDETESYQTPRKIFKPNPETMSKIQRLKEYLLLKSIYFSQLNQCCDDTERERLQSCLSARFSRKAIEDMIKEVAKARNCLDKVDNKIDRDLLIMVGGITKVFIGELVEECIERKGEDDKSAITPSLLRQVYEEKKNSGKLPFISDKISNTINLV